MENGEEPDPDAGISVAYDLLQQNIEKSKAMADADDDLRYVGSSKESWMLDSKFQVMKFVIGTNFADFARRFRVITR